MKARLITVKTIRIACPNCGEATGDVGHILDRTGPASFGPWFCDECGRGYSGELLASGEIDLRLADTTKVDTIDHLVLPPQKEPVHFIVKGMAFVDGSGGRAEPDHKRFFYEEHTCPTNFIGAEMIALAGDIDPHGLFKFVATQDWPKDFDIDEDYGTGAASQMIFAFKDAPARD